MTFVRFFVKLIYLIIILSNPINKFEEEFMSFFIK